MKSFKEFINEDYRSSHNAPGPHFGDPLHDVTRTMYPKDFYGPKGRHLYGDGHSSDALSHGIMMSARNKPDHPIKIYRAVPHNKDGPAHKINHGDWVTGSREYAKGHGEKVLGKGNYKIVSKTVPAKHVYTNGDSIHEWGYHADD